MADQYEAAEKPASLTLSLMTPCKVDASQAGKLALKQAPLARGRVSGAGTLDYDPAVFTVAVEAIDVKDGRLQSIWGSGCTAWYSLRAIPQAGGRSYRFESAPRSIRSHPASKYNGAKYNSVSAFAPNPFSPLEGANRVMLDFWTAQVNPVTIQPSAKAAQRGEPSYVWRAGQERRLEMIRQAAGERAGGRVLEDGCGVGAVSQPPGAGAPSRRSGWRSSLSGG